MRQQNLAFFVYPVVGVLVLAAALPLVSLGGGGREESAPRVDAEPRPARVVVASTLGSTVANNPEMLEAPLVPVANVPVAIESRWWRAQIERLAPVSVVRVASALPKTAPAPVMERAQREAAALAVAAAAATVTAVQPPRGSPPALAPGELRLSDRVPPAIRRWEPLILRAGKKYGLDPYLIAALMQTESAGDPRALSPMNAVGLLQVLNGPADPETNIDQGAAMLASHVKRFGNASLALAAYNAGPNAVAQYGGIPPYEETYNHVTRTLASYAAYRGG